MREQNQPITELTLEITDYCPHKCKFCSSSTTDIPIKAKYLPFETIRALLDGKEYSHLIISGGEPLSHPDFYNILELCKWHSKDVVVYSNAITHLIYNQNVIDGVYLEANVTVLPEVDKIHVLRRVKQGRENDRPEVHLSKNFSQECSCEHHVIRPDGSVTKAPCNKYTQIPIDKL